MLANRKSWNPELIFRASNMEIRDFQKFISQKYEKRDRERGTAPTFMWFVEEVGELATALHGTDQANKEEEFADVLAWLCTLANIADVDLEKAIEKYTKKEVKGFK
jgi:NTP pyrophosphatase (non-canonical NTP hydrolase)